MSSRRARAKRFLQNEWPWIAIGIIADFAIGVGLDTVKTTEGAKVFTTGEILTINLTWNVLVLVMYLIEKFTRVEGLREKELTKLYFKREDVVEDAEGILRRAKTGTTINAMWSQMPLDESLKQYFDRTLKAAKERNIHTVRLVDIVQVPIDSILEHLKDCWNHLTSRDYSIVFIGDAHFEMILSEDEGINFQSHERSQVTLGFSCPSSAFLSKLREIYESLLRGSKEFRTRRIGSRFDVEKCRAELEKIKKEFTKEID